jgi:oligopeptide transport system ATP-binding protein
MNGVSLLELQELKLHFKVKRGKETSLVRAVDGVSFTVNQGETVGLVGESGCGKSTIGRAIMRFHKPSGGKILFRGRDITAENIAPYSSKMQMVFQDPYASLNPRMSINDIVGEPLDIQFPNMPKAERNARILEQIHQVGMNSSHLQRFAHEFSGGQRQRVAIARALITSLDFLICDEPVSALDVSIQAQIINMLMDLQDKLGLAYLFISHDLSVVRHIAGYIVVMYLGHVMEAGAADDIYNEALHPYTHALLSAIPIPDPNTSRARQRTVLQGDVPSPANPPSGCVFHTRCPRAEPRCAESAPEIRELGGRRRVACHLV